MKEWVTLMTVILMAGCTTVSKHVVYEADGIVVTAVTVTDYALKATGHGGYIANGNVIDLYGKKYSMVGRGRAFIAVPERKLLFFVSSVPREVFGSDRELHVVNTGARTDTIIPLGDGTWSGPGDDFGAHMPGSPYEEKVEFEGDAIARFTTYDGVTTPTEVYEPEMRTVFVVDLKAGKLLSRQKEPISAKETRK